MKKILAVIIYPYRKVPVFQPINVENFKSIVGEQIEKADINEKFAVIYDGRGKEKGKDINLTIKTTGENIYGTAIICKTEGEELKNLDIRESCEADKLYIRY
ncbi:MAG: hypothetical protein Q4D26_12140 [Clostridia bacterium]|nr:hypothetical protein [Clostridia bacterium]